MGAKQLTASRLLDEIVSESTGVDVPLTSTLRKCLVLARTLKNDRLKEWAHGELDGYPDRAIMPDYRVVRVLARGWFLGSFGRQIGNQPIPSAVLEERDREWAQTAYLGAGIAAYQDLLGDSTDDGTLQVPWPADLVLKYQSKFFGGDLALNRAWQEIPKSAVALLVDTVRTRLLSFALELQEQSGDDPAAPEDVQLAEVDAAVTNIIYGGNNVISTGVRGSISAQVGINIVSAGDFASLTRALLAMGVHQEDIGSLRSAIDQDKGGGASDGYGEHTAGWMAKVAKYLGKTAGKVAEGTSVGALTKVILAYLGIAS